MPSLERGLRILKHLSSQSAGQSLSDLAAILRIPRSSVAEILIVLIENQLITREQRGIYVVGPVRLGMSDHSSSEADLLAAANFETEALRNETGETSHVAVLRKGLVNIVCAHEGTNPISVTPTSDSPIPVNWTAAGQLLLSDLSDQELAQQLPILIKPSPTRRAPMSIKWLIKEIRSARKARIAKQLGWADPAIGNLASPIIVEKQCVATLGIDVPRHRLDGKDESALYRSVREGAARLSRRLWQMQLDDAKDRMRRNSSPQTRQRSLK